MAIPVVTPDLDAMVDDDNSVMLSRVETMRDDPARSLHENKGFSRRKSMEVVHRHSDGEPVYDKRPSVFLNRQTLLLEQGRGRQERDYHTSAHTQSIDQLTKDQNSNLGSDGNACREGPAGLPIEEVPGLTFVCGPNLISPKQPTNWLLKLFVQVFCGIFNFVLWFCVIVQAGLLFAGQSDDMATPIFLAIVIVAAGTLQWYTEMKAEGLMDALANMRSTKPVQVVRRSAKTKERKDLLVDPADLLPGDIIFLKSGDRIPADIRILWCTDGAEVDNAALTGESMPEKRDPSTCPDAMAPTQARNLAFYGTTLVKGNITAMVFFTGDRTFLGKIAESIKMPRPRSSLEHQIEHFVHLVAFISVFVGVLSLVVTMSSPVKHSVGFIISNAATALFAQVPEGLIPTVTISLMMASSSMSSVNMLIRKLDAIETLGCVSVVCSDKTGTLTSGEMTLRDLAHFDNQGKIAFVTEETFLKTSVLNRSSLPSTLLRQGVRNNCTIIASEGHYIGTPTEASLMKAAVDAWGVSTVKDMMDNPILYEIPFDSAHKYMFVAEQVGPGKQLFCLKGAPERVLKFCSSAYVGDAGEDKVVPMSAEMITMIEKAQKSLMEKARRVLAIAQRDSSYPADFSWNGTSPEKATAEFLTGMVFIGLFGIQDPPKPGVKEAVEKCQNAGIRVIMITGDHPDTAVAISREISIVPPEGELAPLTVITDKELIGKVPETEGFSGDGSQESLLLEQFWKDVVANARVFARVTPIHKQLIVQALQKWGCVKDVAYGTFSVSRSSEIVAMTGDGVNDAPALKQADVGIAMGRRGTEVARDAADIILLDDDFSSIVAGIEQGRLTAENLRKSVAYTLCSKVPQSLPMFADVAGVRPALNNAQILAIDIGTDIWTAIAYAWQPKEGVLMTREPRHPRKSPIVTSGVCFYAYLYVGIMQSICCCSVYFHTIHTKHWEHLDDLTAKRGSTMYYYTLVVAQVGAALATTTQLESLWSYGLPNVYLNVCFVIEMCVAGSIIYVPQLQSVFGTTALTNHELLLPWGAVALIVVVEELRKAWLRMRHRAALETRALRDSMSYP